MYMTISDKEIRVEISSNGVHTGKTAVTVVVANALKAAFPDTNVIVEDPEGCFLARQESMAQVDSDCTLSVPSIRIVDNPRLLCQPPLPTHQVIVIETKPNDAVALLIQAYAKGEVNNEMDWSDVDNALAVARVERPGYYETALRAVGFLSPSINQKGSVSFEPIDEDHGSG